MGGVTDPNSFCGLISSLTSVKDFEIRLEETVQKRTFTTALGSQDRKNLIGFIDYFVELREDLFDVFTSSN